MPSIPARLKTRCQVDLMRNDYHKFIKDTMDNLRAEHPEMSGRDILKLAREQPEPQTKK